MMHFPLDIQLRSSPWLRVMLAGFHCLAAIAFFAVAWRAVPPMVIAIVVLSLGGSACLADRAERRKSGLRLVLGDSGLMAMEPGVRESAMIQSGCVDQGWAVWLRWRASGTEADSHSGAMMLVRGNLSSGDWRRLRIWLRHKASPGAVA